MIDVATERPVQVTPFFEQREPIKDGFVMGFQ
jgi:hypothetical protein